ncbi:MAG: 2Fe-2S iron-sulfur cluster-binding protein [Flavobacteriales bacterium]|jgi:2Fe-2S ferredoxin|nr:2Fe-2S iron-sulfur cluster-binding protein [Flavobacteriales bacterium]
MDNIITVTVIDREGVEHQLEAPTDMNMNMMELCKSYELPVKGTCGGMAMCASCQMYVLNDKVTLERNEDEQLMLDEAWHVEDNSRLGCQIHLTNEMDGLLVQLAPEVEEDDDDDW